MKFLITTIFIFTSISLPNTVFLCQSGTVYFKSDAPLELIEATSNQLKGVIDTEKRTFAFSINMNTFKGFNSPLQQEHFDENYLEIDKYPKATFKGKIIEKIDFTTDGTHSIRTKGQLNIHGIEQERIIKSKVTIKKGTFNVQSNFTVLLEEHNITIPKIVYQKIAEEIEVQIEAAFEKK